MIEIPNRAALPLEDALQRHKYLVHATYVDGSQAYELADTKEDANGILQGLISDPEVSDWIAYEVIKFK